MGSSDAQNVSTSLMLIAFGFKGVNIDIVRAFLEENGWGNLFTSLEPWNNAASSNSPSLEEMKAGSCLCQPVSKPSQIYEIIRGKVLTLRFGCRPRI